MLREVQIARSAARFLTGGWRHPARDGFSYYRESSLRLFVPVLPLLLVGDVALLEFVVLPDAALWLTIAVHAAAIYGVLWVVGL